MKGLKRKHVKRIILLLVVIICFNIIASNLSCVEAANDQIFTDGMGNSSPGMTEEQEQQVQEILGTENESNTVSKESTVFSGLADYFQLNGDNPIASFLEGLVGLLILGPLRLVCIVMGLLLQTIASAVASIAGQEFNLVTIDDILFNRVGVTDINFFDLDGAGSALRVLRELIAGWYYTLRNLSIVILLCILVYLGIRMAISTVASEKAVYKKMLIDWMVSFAIIFVIHYIILITINVSNALVEIIANTQSSELAQSTTFWKSYTGEIFELATSWTFLDGMGGSIMYLMLGVALFGYLFVYIKRMVTIAFLILIAPIITITYSIDKIKDSKSQALDTWVKEFAFNVLLQPFDCLIYVIFVSSAISITGQGIGGLVLAIIMLTFRKQAMDIVKNMFGFGAAKTLGQEIVGTAAAMTMLKNAGKMGAGKVKDAITGTKTKRMPKMQDLKNDYQKQVEDYNSRKQTQLQEPPQDSSTGGSGGTTRNSNAGGDNGFEGRGTSGETQNTNSNGQPSDNLKNPTNQNNKATEEWIKNLPDPSKQKFDLKEMAKKIGKGYLTAQSVAAGTILGAAMGFAQGDLSQGFSGAVIGYHGQKAARIAANNAMLRSKLKTNESVFADQYDKYQVENKFDSQEMSQRTQALLEMDREKILQSDKLDDRTKAYGLAVQDMRDSYESIGMKEKDAREKVLNTVKRVQNQDVKLRGKEKRNIRGRRGR